MSERASIIVVDQRLSGCGRKLVRLPATHRAGLDRADPAARGVPPPIGRRAASSTLARDTGENSAASLLGDIAAPIASSPVSKISYWGTGTINTRALEPDTGLWTRAGGRG